MSWKSNVLVVANVTATSEDLVRALHTRAEREPTSFTLIIPATPFGGGRAAAAEMLDTATRQLQAAGLEVDGSIGHSDPIVAVANAWDPKRYDEVIVSTLPMRLSKWLHAGLPERIAKVTGARVTHVISEPPKPALKSHPAPAHEHWGVLAPYSALRSGRSKQH